MQVLHCVITKIPLRSVIIIWLAAFILKWTQNKTKSQQFLKVSTFYKSRICARIRAVHCTHFSWEFIFFMNKFCDVVMLSSNSWMITSSLFLLRSQSTSIKSLRTSSQVNLLLWAWCGPPASCASSAVETVPCLEEIALTRGLWTFICSCCIFSL